MEKKIRQLWNNKYIFFLHLFVNAILIVFSVTYYFSGDADMVEKYIVSSAYAAICIILQLISFRGKRHFLAEQTVVGQIYYFLQPAVALVLYYMAFTKLEGTIFLILMILYYFELFFYMAVGQKARRIALYILFLISYGVISVVMLVFLIQDSDSRVTLSIGIREIATVFCVLVLLILVGEMLAVLWDCFEEQILKQNRALEDLNEVNESLHEHQEKINRVNEKLGMQKIELQAANKKINRSHDEMSVQNEISSAIASSVEKEDMLKRVVNIMQIRLDMDVVAIILEEDNSLLVPGEEPQGRFVALSTVMGKSYEKNLLDSVYETDLKELLLMTKTYIQNTETDSVKLFSKMTEEQELPSMICLPIMNQEERLGTLFVGKNRNNAFMDSRAFYENIASQLSIGIANVRLYAKMNDMAIRDGLTRIYNRRYLTELLNEYLTDAMARKVPVSLALFDIDKFKMVNDTYGHQCGDEVIRYVATLLNKGAIVNGGIAGRYGGEEFVVAFCGKGLDETYNIVKEIHEKIRSEEVTYGDKTIKVRASAGIASYPETCADPGELLTRADWAMYHSKKNGRDQITIDSDQISAQM